MAWFLRHLFECVRTLLLWYTKTYQTSFMCWSIQELISLQWIIKRTNAGLFHSCSAYYMIAPFIMQFKQSTSDTSKVNKSQHIILVQIQKFLKKSKYHMIDYFLDRRPQLIIYISPSVPKKMCKICLNLDVSIH
jgi:hypothetical protein